MTAKDPDEVFRGEEVSDRTEVPEVGALAWAASARSPFEALVGPLLGGAGEGPAPDERIDAGVAWPVGRRAH